MFMLNLTVHAASPDQIEQGLRDVGDKVRLKALLDIPEEALMASDEVLDNYLDGKVQEIISEFVLPTLLVRIQVELSLGAEMWPQGVELLNRARQMGHVDVMIGGAPILMERLIPALRKVGAEPYWSLSGRKSVDEHLPDGSVKKTSVHAHLRFRRAM